LRRMLSVMIERALLPVQRKRTLKMRSVISTFPLHSKKRS
jgi:hypothetical protein